MRVLGARWRSAHCRRVAARAKLSVHGLCAFVEMRGIVASDKGPATKVNALEHEVSMHEHHIAELADTVSQLLVTPT